MSTGDLDLSACDEWMQSCGVHDAGLPMLCNCPDKDPRPVIAALVEEVRRLRAELDEMVWQQREQTLTAIAREEYVADLRRTIASIHETYTDLIAEGGPR